jgi:ethanolamine permease
MAEGNALKGGTLGPVSLIGLGLSYILVGNYVAWGYALQAGGIGGLLSSLVLVVALFVCIALCLSELVGLHPSAGGGAAIVERALGAPFGHLAGAAVLIEYVCGTAALASFAAGYVEPLLGIGGGWIMLLLLGGVALVHIVGVSEALGFSLIIAGIAIAGIIVFSVAAVPHLELSRLGDIPPGAGYSAWFPAGLRGAWAALPFSVTFFITLEGVPFAAEEASNAKRDIPLAMLGTLAIGAISAIAVSVLGPAAAGAITLSGAPDPLEQALRTLHSEHAAVLGKLVECAASASLVASVFGGIFASSRILFHLGRLGAVPRWLARTNRRGAPWLAVLLSAATAAVFAREADSAQLVVLFVFSATLLYLLLLLSHLVLRLREADALRPFRSPGGLFLPIFGAALAGITFIACFLADVRWSLVGILLSVGVAALLFVSERRSGQAA